MCPVASRLAASSERCHRLVFGGLPGTTSVEDAGEGSGIFGIVYHACLIGMIGSNLFLEKTRLLGR